MGFIERIIKEEVSQAKILRAAQKAHEKERIARENAEREYKAKRKKQAEEFHQESGVRINVDELIKFLERPTISYVYYENNDGFQDLCTGYRGRESQGLPNPPVLNQKDQDSILDTAH